MSISIETANHILALAETMRATSVAVILAEGFEQSDAATKLANAAAANLGTYVLGLTLEPLPEPPIDPAELTNTECCQ